MQVKPKKCKGIGRAKGYAGCGSIHVWRKYGLCKQCYANWLYNTPEGKEVLSNAKLRGKKKAAEYLAKQQRKKERKQREELKPKSYWENKLQTIINRIVRKIDRGHACISSGRALGEKYDAGHFYSIGSNASLRFNLLNIWAQSVEQNQYKGGNPQGYAENLHALFGREFYEEVLSLKRKYPVIKLSIPELKECIERAKEAEKWIEDWIEDVNIDVFTVTNRIGQEYRVYLRREVNKKIGIY